MGLGASDWCCGSGYAGSCLRRNDRGGRRNDGCDVGHSRTDISGVMVTLRARELPTGEVLRANGKEGWQGGTGEAVADVRVSCLDRPGYVGSCLRRNDGWGCGNQGTRGGVGVKEGRKVDEGRRGCVLGGRGQSRMEISGVMVTLRARELPTGEALKTGLRLRGAFRANGKEG